MLTKTGQSSDSIEATSVGLTGTSNPEECLDYCTTIEDCNYFTHYEDSDFCVAYRDCPATNSACNDCISGDKKTLVLEKRW